MGLIKTEHKNKGKIKMYIRPKLPPSNSVFEFLKNHPAEIFLGVSSIFLDKFEFCSRKRIKVDPTRALILFTPPSVHKNVTFARSTYITTMATLRQ